MPFGQSPAPQGKPQPKPEVPEDSEPQDVQRSTMSRELEAYYGRVQAELLDNDLLRTDDGTTDAPFTARQLARNFVEIALNDEYTSVAGQYIARRTPSSLHRWDVPVRISLEFGASVPPEVRERDRETVSALTRRLARATGHSVSFADWRPNFHILVLNEDERRKIGPRLEQLIPGIGQSAIRSVENMPRSSYCLVIASDPQDDGAYRRAVAVIRGEHPDLMRRSCFHEEIAQGLGLANDSPAARPSIFNDDEEFALLTPHDELLLQMLYDKRLDIGMTAENARPIIDTIAKELVPEGS